MCNIHNLLFPPQQLKGNQKLQSLYSHLSLSFKNLPFEDFRTSLKFLKHVFYESCLTYQICMDGPSCPASPNEVAVLRIETENYYIAAHHIILTLEPEAKKTPEDSHRP